MASGTIPKPVELGPLLQCTFDDLFDYGNGIFSLRPGTDSSKPSSASYFMVLQFKMLVSGAEWGSQFAVTTDTTLTYYMRKHRGSSGWTAWKSLTFS